MSSAPNVHPSSHPLIMHKITQMRKARLSPKYLNQLLKEVSLFLCYEATASLPLTDCEVTTSLGVESGRRLAERIGIVPILRGGLGMVEAMTEIVSNAQARGAPPPLPARTAPPHPRPFRQVWHVGIYRDPKSLVPVEYYNKLPKHVTVHTVFVLDPLPISGATWTE